MSHDNDHGDDPARGASTIKSSKGGGGAGKWLIGGLAAVVLASGGYAAYKTFSPGQGTDVAYNDEYVGDDPSGEPLNFAAPQEALADNGVAAPAATDDDPPARTQRRAPAHTAAAVPEETIGVTPQSTSDEASIVEASVDGDDVIVRARRRPVWASVPAARRLTAYYPERARATGREGEARLHCIVEAGGVLDCDRVEETSAMFGVAAMRVARTFRHAETLPDGRDAVGTPVNLRVVFRLEDEQRRGPRYASQ